jgi:hypothetical protein
MRNHIFLLILFLGITQACKNESEPELDKSTFTRIYDNNKFNASFFPIDIGQTSDGGYLILGGRKLTNTSFSGIYILKVDELGQIVLEKEVDETFVNPIGPLLESGGNYYFFCMTSIGLQSQLVSITPAGEINEPIQIGGSYPAAAGVDGSNFILLSYDNLNKLSVVSVITPGGSVVKSKGFSIGAGDAVEEPIINHFLKTGKQFPFLTGRTSSGQYYFNGFYNYTFSLVFTDLNQDDPAGVVQGQQDDGGLSQVVPLEGSKFALSRFNFGDNFYIPTSTLNTSAISSSVDLGGYNLLELVPDATVKILRTTIGGQRMLLYGSDTRNRQIGIMGYDEATGTLLGSRYLGFSNPFEIASIKSTNDGGLIICGTTYLASRFPRICLFKLSKTEVEKTFR